MYLDASIVITSFRDNFYLDKLLNSISLQNLNNLNVEIIILDAGNYNKGRAIKKLKSLSSRLIYLSENNLSRTESLNKIFYLSKGEIIIRLDTRSVINKNYISSITKLSRSTKAEVVGGKIKSIFSKKGQEIVAKAMNHPLMFGGGKFRNTEKFIKVDSVYLGAFNKEKCINLIGDENWFDINCPKISEDSDLNYRIREKGGTILCDPSIIVEHYPRENLGSFLKLCFNYGRGRALFCKKHNSFSAKRQLIAIFLSIQFLTLILSSIFYHIFALLIILEALIYLFLLLLKLPKRTSFKESINILMHILFGQTVWIYAFIFNLI